VQDRALWDAALERLGREVVLTKLNNLGSLPGTTFPLNGLPEGTRSPKCEYVVAWLGRTGAAETATRRHRLNLAVTIVLGIVGIVVAIVTTWSALLAALAAVWFAVRDWIR
jgi:hypothetical protein